MNRKRVVLNSLPSIPVDKIDWGENQYILTTTGSTVAPANIGDLWDHQENLKIVSQVKVEAQAVRELPIHAPISLRTSAICDATLLSVTETSILREDDDFMVATTEVHLSGTEMSQRIRLQQRIVADLSATSTLPGAKATIVARAPELTVPLTSDEPGFPTSVYSFKEAGRPQIPWLLDTQNDDLTTDFSSCVRLHVNSDLDIGKKLATREFPVEDSSLRIAIIRSVISAVASAKLSGEDASVQLLEDFPESLLATADKLARLHLGIRIENAIDFYIHRPEQLEMKFLEMATTNDVFK